MAFLYSIFAVPFTLGQCYFNYLTINIVLTEEDKDTRDTWGYTNKFYDQLLLIGQTGLGIGMIFLPYLSDVIVQRIFYFKPPPALLWYHYSVFPLLIFNFLAVYTGYQSVELLFPTQTITFVRRWLRRVFHLDAAISLSV